MVFPLVGCFSFCRFALGVQVFLESIQVLDGHGLGYGVR